MLLISRLNDLNIQVAATVGEFGAITCNTCTGIGIQMITLICVHIRIPIRVGIAIRGNRISILVVCGGNLRVERVTQGV